MADTVDIDEINRYLGTFVSLLLVLIAVIGLYNSLQNIIGIFEGIAIALLSIVIIMLLTLYYRIEMMSRES